MFQLRPSRRNSLNKLIYNIIFVKLHNSFLVGEVIIFSHAKFENLVKNHLNKLIYNIFVKSNNHFFVGNMKKEVDSSTNVR